MFVVDVTSLTERGFVGSSSFAGEQVDLEFDDRGAGVFLTSRMAARLDAKKGSKVLVSVEDGSALFVELPVSGVTRSPRFSDEKLYYAIGHEGGAVVRVRRA